MVKTNLQIWRNAGPTSQPSQKTRDFDPVLVSFWASVADVGPAINEHRILLVLTGMKFVACSVVRCHKMMANSPGTF